MKYYINSTTGQIYIGINGGQVGDRLTTQAEMDAYDLARTRAQKLIELKAKCDQLCEADFVSNALGANYTYPNKYNKDQHNLMAQCTDAIDDPLLTFYFPCADVNGVWAHRLHTAPQIKQVGKASRLQVQTTVITYAAKAATVEAATTVAAVNAVIW